jgi:hypothetical protein
MPSLGVSTGAELHYARLRHAQELAHVASAKGTRSAAPAQPKPSPARSWS